MTSHNCSPKRPYVAHGLTVSVVRDGAIQLEERPILRDGATAFPVLRSFVPLSDEREHFVTAFLTVRMALIGYNVVSIGCLTASIVHPREVFRPAILAGAASIILAHNHPSNDPEPSPEDVALTRRLVAAGSLIGIEILDHIVMAETRYVSLKQRGVL